MPDDHDHICSVPKGRELLPCLRKHLRSQDQKTKSVEVPKTEIDGVYRLYLIEGWVQTDKICFIFYKLKPNAFIAARKFIILFFLDNSIAKFILYALCWSKLILDKYFVTFEELFKL